MIHKCLLVIILMAICPELKSEMVGYTRLFKPDTQTTIDILYDLHHDHPKNQLFPSEAKLDQILSTLNECNENVDLVWEYDESISFNLLQRDAIPFIGGYPMHIKENLTNLNFIAADRCRRSWYASLFKRSLSGAACSIFKNTEGSTFEEPVPFGLERRRRMIKRAGNTVYENYVKLYAQTVGELTSYFSDFYRSGAPLSYDRDFLFNDAYAKIADLEMLYHILVSDKKRVIVYCGAFHARNIAVFLASNRYTVLNLKLPTANHEPTLAELEFLYGNGKARWARMRGASIAPSEEDPSVLSARAAAESASEEAVPKSLESGRKRSFLGANLMEGLPDLRALAKTAKYF